MQQQAGQQDQQANIGRGAQYLYLHQQLLARYELNRLSNGLGPIEDVDYENVQSLYQPHLRGLNGLEFAGRPKNLQLQPQRNQLIQHVATLEKRLRDAIDSGNVITPQGVFLSLYQPQGMNILGDLIEGTGRSVNPRSVKNIAYNCLQHMFLLLILKIGIMEVYKLLLANFLEMLLKFKTFGTTRHRHLNLEKLPSTIQFSINCTKKL